MREKSAINLEKISNLYSEAPEILESKTFSLLKLVNNDSWIEMDFWVIKIKQIKDTLNFMEII